MSAEVVLGMGVPTMERKSVGKEIVKLEPSAPLMGIRNPRFNQTGYTRIHRVSSDTTVPSKVLAHKSITANAEGTGLVAFPLRDNGDIIL